MNERQIFEEALQFDDPFRRDLILSHSCENDQALKERVEKLLEAHAAKGHVLDISVADQIHDPPSSNEPISLHFPLNHVLGDDEICPCWSRP